MRAAVQPGVTNINIPATGLIGREQALTQGLSGALRQLQGAGGTGSFAPNYGHVNANRDLAFSQGQQGINALSGYTNPGAQAQSLQAALSGAQGAQAQQDAYNNFQSSPGQQWLVEQAERGLLRNSAAIGGLGGGNVRQALQRQAMGLAQQDFANQFDRLGQVADRGMQGNQLETSLRGQLMNAATSAGSQGAGLQGSAIGANAGIRSAGIQGRNAAIRDAGNYAFETGLQRAYGRTDAGNAIAANDAATRSALSALLNQQGAGVADMLGNRAGQIAGIQTGAGENQFNSLTSLADMLQQISQGASGQRAGLPGIPGTQQTGGIIGQVGNAIGGIGSVLSQMPKQSASGYLESIGVPGAAAGATF